ncbi:MAG: hypothetical protein CFE21_03370 [Bacteroidetes bacterium B1(2017)]|nr:MAG: hypothetical protein CFE21_03370 [Bacteroidetes bacterium B1(2017)]
MIQRLILVSLVLLTFSCKNNQSSSVDYQKLYTHSLEIKDYHTAIFAAQCLLQADSTQKQYLDSLPELYAAVNNFGATDHYVDIALVSRPTDEKLLQIKALCLQEAGKGKELLDFYNKLYASTNKISYLYQVATIQLTAGDVKGAQSSIETLESKMANSTDSVDFMISETEKQKVPIRAAVYNVKAYVAAQNNNLLGAKKNFELALKEYPDFITAQQNYMRLMQGARGGK